MRAVSERSNASGYSRQKSHAIFAAIPHFLPGSLALIWKNYGPEPHAARRIRPRCHF